MTISRSDIDALRLAVKRTGANLRQLRVYHRKRPTQRLIKAHQRHIDALKALRAALEELTEGSHP